ncbi:MAG TPA: proton-conducting transporter membrane subunit [Planctomycetota bacterium]|nr:proton-conducting transporter membrane subunit [Planctomycetota bacterium]
MSVDWVIVAIVLSAASGVPGLCLPRSSIWGQRIAVGMIGCGAMAGLMGAGLALFSGAYSTVEFPWQAAGGSVLGVDALSAFFLAAIFLMGALGSIYGLGYWPQNEHPENARGLQFFWGLLVAGMALLVSSVHAMAFLFGWEMMALSAFFLVCTEDDNAECRRAGWLYLIATHIGTLSLFALFALWRWATNSYALRPIAADAMGLGMMNGLFFLALIGFGLKAGVMPLHFWLPTAHAAAPSHVSAMLSGIVLKMGIYGLLRFLSLLAAPPVFWGGLILILGAVSGLLGVLFALGQHDLKRLLAYHSVENIGIILMGLGLAMLGRSMGRPEWVVLGLAGCLLHVWNHSLFKSLLFLCAGSVVHATHTREIDKLGGLAKSMRWTALLFLLGAVAICGLPPLNGFISELFVYLGLFQTIAEKGASGSAAALVIAVLALIGGLALACFLKVYGAVFLGNMRDGATETRPTIHEAPVSMRAPMFVIAACCVLIGVAPALLTNVLENVIAAWMPELPRASVSLGTLVPLKSIGFMSLALAAVVALLALLTRRAVVAPYRQAGTWDCGYAQTTSRMQYTASSFARSIVNLFGGILRPRTHEPEIKGNFPRPAALETHVDDAVLDRLLVPAAAGLERSFSWFHRFQQGLTQHYVLYILFTVLVLLSTLIPFGDYFAKLFAR